MMQLHILVVDDEPAIRQILASQLGKAGHAVDHVGRGEEAVDCLSSGDYDVCICDMRLPGIDGIEVLRRCKAQGVDTSFLMITAFASVQTAIDAMKLGAFDYLMKPLQPEDVLHRLSHIAYLTRLRDENRYLREIVETAGRSPETLGVSDAMRSVESLVDRFGRTDGTVLITGESGTGKSYIARAIHRRSARAEGPLVSVNCGAIPENLLESELFGHVKGAFTGADRAKKGLFREADGGTLFLDEIGELPLPLQVKLLHVIEDREIRPVGGEQSRRVDVRIIAATNMDLGEMVGQGTFRKDLFYRLNVLHISIPPLRERRDDIPFFVRHFMEAEVRRLGLDGDYKMDPAAEELLMKYDWPGNLRELQNVIARALVLADGREVRLSDLPAQVARTTRPEGLAAIPEGGGTLRELVKRYETQVIRRAMDQAGGDRMAAAQALGIGLSTLYRKLEES
jgi:two-component system response regulator AtoC